jgi:hypothetical protein
MYNLESLVSYCVDVWSTFFIPSPVILFCSACCLGDFTLDKSTSSTNQRGGRVGFSTSRKALGQRKIFCPQWESNLDVYV